MMQCPTAGGALAARHRRCLTGGGVPALRRTSRALIQQSAFRPEFERALSGWAR